MNEDCLVRAMVPDPLEEYPPAQQGDLKYIDVDIYTVIMPCVCSDCVRKEGREQPVEVEQKE